MESFLETTLLGFPIVQALVVWAASAVGVLVSLEAIALTLIPFAKMTSWAWDDVWLKVAHYWLDAAGDVLAQVAIGKFRRAWKVVTRIREDLGKPYSERRMD